ncbi:nitroreductase family protein [Paenibacillus albidus]|uniref:nitroreductase family protein n=1 Tax=Paenibacillus albidus TaxID=2041023 RepID=UPI001BEA6961|nr:nitroreductase family protein [Paenibacillus albidus]MBT2290296.1 nitroreductase family protein [Paenibacillus albidus]
MLLANLAMEATGPVCFRNQPVPQELVLELLNHAVWAPNDGLREPWRFIFVDHRNADRMVGLQEPAPAYLIVVMKEEADRYKRDEDFAAVSCLMQNLELLAPEKGLGIRRTLNEWRYDRQRAGTFGVWGNEWIAGVLELGYAEQVPGRPAADSRPELRFELL